MTTWQQSDEKFKRLLLEGYFWQMEVAKRLVEKNLTVYVPPLRWRKTYKDAESFKDDKDITVGSTVKLWLEVKSTYLPFDNVNDLPDPMKLVTVSSWKKLEDKPFGVAIISKKTNEIVFAPTKFEEKWQTQEIDDPVRGFSEPWLVCGREVFYPFTDLVNVLRVRTK